MKRILVLFLLATRLGLADVYSVTIHAASVNIPTAFSTSAASMVIRNVRNVRSILINNGASTRVAVNCSGSDNSAPSDSSNHNIYVPATGSVAIDNAYLSVTCYIRSMGSAISSGDVDIMLIGG